MVTLIKYGALSGGVKYNINQMWICGLSTDSKSTTTIDGMPIPNGSVYTEVDTGKNFMFDYDNTTWYEVSIGGGGTSGGIVLVGETTTALTDNATTNPITVDGQSYIAQPNDAVIYGSKEFLFDGTKWHEFGDLSGLASKDIGAMTGYAKASTGSAIAPTDTLNQAIGKVEKRVDVNENNISKFHKAANTDIYFSETEPTGDITVGSYWISTSAIKLSSGGDMYGTDMESGSWVTTELAKTDVNNRCRCNAPITIDTTLTYTVTLSIPTNNQILVHYRNNLGATISESGWQSSGYQLVIPSNTAQITVIAKKTNGDDCQPSDFGILSVTTPVVWS